MNDRPNCLNISACVAKTPGKHCPRCSLTAIRKDPAVEAKRAAAFRDKIANDPDFRAKHCAASGTRLKQWRKTKDGATFYREHGQRNLRHCNTPEAIAARTEAVRRTRVGWCPPERYDEYQKLARSMPAGEARRIIEADIALQERRRLASMTPHERAMDRVARGATLSTKSVMRKADHAFSLTGSSMG